MTEIGPVLGVLAGAIGVADMIPYVRDTLRGTTRPHRGTWLIWGALAVVVSLSQYADGASWSLIMAATGALLNSLIFALSISRGVGEMIFRGLPPSDPEARSPGSQRSSVHDRLRTAGPHPLPVAVTSTTEGREPNA